MRTAYIGPLIFGFQLVDYSGRIRRYGLLGGSISMGVGSEASNQRPSLAFSLLSACGSDVSAQLLLQHHACVPP